MSVRAPSGSPAASTPRPVAAYNLVTPMLTHDVLLKQVACGHATLLKGASGDAVKHLQEALKMAGTGAAVTGTMDDATAKALMGLQAKAKLPKTGTLDAATLYVVDRYVMTGTIAAPKRAPATPPAAPQPSEPTAYDSNYFTDADALQPLPGVRKYLDQALHTGRADDIRALRWEDMVFASVDERAKLVGKLLDGHTDGASETWLIQLMQRSNADTGKLLDKLASKGRLAQLVADFQGDNRTVLLKQLPGYAVNASTAAHLVGALAADDTRQNRLAAHHVMDAARAGGFLDPMLKSLKAGYGTNRVAMDLASQAKPTIRPMIIGHRGGDPVNFPENTLGAIRAGLAKGSEAIEIDITVTKDDQIVLWHDFEQDNLVAAMRETGIEPGMGFKPLLPPQGHAARRPVYELNLPAFRANFGYSARDGNIFTNKRVNVDLPTMDQVAKLAKKHPELKKIYLDVKLPPDKPEVQKRFAVKLKSILEQYNLQNRVVLMHNTASVVKNLKDTLGSKYAITHDVEIISLAPSADDYSAVKSAEKLDNTVASVGRPRLGINGYETYLEVLKKDRASLKESGKKTDLVTWTLNDELEIREAMSAGVNGIITDEPAMMQRVLRAYKMQ